MGWDRKIADPHFSPAAKMKANKLILVGSLIKKMHRQEDRVCHFQQSNFDKHVNDLWWL